MCVYVRACMRVSMHVHVCTVLLNAELTNCEMYPSLIMIMIVHHLVLSLAVKEKT